MNLPKDFPELEGLLEQMQTTFQPFKSVVDIQLSKEGIPVLPGEFDVIDNIIPIIQNRKAVFYIWDAYNYRRRWRTEPKYHVVNCEKLQEMQEKNRFNQYRAARPTNGKFPVKPSSSGEPSRLKLILCQFCLIQLKAQYGKGVFPGNPQEFPLEDWFETFGYNEESDQVEFPEGPFDYSSKAWRKRSSTCRENAHWTCEQCGIDLKDNRHFLDAHHKWGTKFNNPEDLKALCIRCHAEQPGHGHETLKYDSRYQEFMKKYGSVLPSEFRPLSKPRF